MTRWYYTSDNKQRLGPVSAEQLRQLALAGTIRPEHMVMREAGGKWIPAAKVKGLFLEPARAGSPPAQTVNVTCPGCGRTIPLPPHELSLTIECAQCKTRFVPRPQAALRERASGPIRRGVLVGVALIVGLCCLGVLTVPLGLYFGLAGRSGLATGADAAGRGVSPTIEPDGKAATGPPSVFSVYDTYKRDLVAADREYLNKTLTFTISPDGVDKDDKGYFAYINYGIGPVIPEASPANEFARPILCYFRELPPSGISRKAELTLRGVCRGKTGTAHFISGYSGEIGGVMQHPYSVGQPVITFEDCVVVKAVVKEFVHRGRPPVTVKVVADKPWQDSGVDLPPGANLTFRAQGHWSVGDVTTTWEGLGLKAFREAEDLRLSEEEGAALRNGAASYQKVRAEHRAFLEARQAGTDELSKALRSCPVRNAPYMCLLCRSGADGAPAAATELSAHRTTLQPPGRLFLQANIGSPAGARGSLDVEIVVEVSETVETPLAR
jgi:hypothetical protein